MSTTIPVREFRTHLADLLDEVADRREHVTVYRIIYQLRDDKTVRVIAIRHRGNTYGTDPR